MDIRETVGRALKINKGFRTPEKVSLTSSEKTIVETVRKSPLFAAIKGDLDRHTIKTVISSVTVEPISICEALATKIDRMIRRGWMNLDLTENSGTLNEDGGTADSLAGEHDGSEDVAQAAPDAADAQPDTNSDADKGSAQNDDKRGDTAEAPPQDISAEGNPTDAAPKANGNGGKKNGNGAPPATGDEDKEKKESRKKGKGKVVSEDEDAPAPAADGEGTSDGDPPADPEKDAVQDGEYEPEPEFVAEAKKLRENLRKKISKTSESLAKLEAAFPFLKEDDNSLGNEAQDAEETPSYDCVEPVKAGELDAGPADPSISLESFQDVEKKIVEMIGRAGIKKGSKKWQEAYEKGFSLAISSRARKLSEVGKSAKAPFGKTGV